MYWTAQKDTTGPQTSILRPLLETPLHSMARQQHSGKLSFQPNSPHWTYCTHGRDAQKNLQNPKARGPVSNVHVDYTVESGPHRIHEVLPEEADRLKKTPFAVIQVSSANARLCVTHFISACVHNLLDRLCFSSLSPATYQ